MLKAKKEIQNRDAARVKNLGGPVVMRRAAAARQRLLICQNLGGQRPPRPPTLVHACDYILIISYYLRLDITIDSR